MTFIKVKPTRSVTLVLTLISILIFLAGFVNHIYASDTEPINTPTIRYEKINPDRAFLFKVKRLFEKVKVSFIDTFNKDQKIPFLIKLTNKRLAEFSYIIENSEMSYLEKASSRYITYTGLLSENVGKNRTSSEQIKEALKSHPNILERLRDNYPAQTAEWLFVQQTLDSSVSLLSQTEE